MSSLLIGWLMDNRRQIRLNFLEVASRSMADFGGHIHDAEQNKIKTQRNETDIQESQQPNTKMHFFLR